MFGSVSWLEATIVPEASSARAFRATEAGESPGLITLVTYHTWASPESSFALWVHMSRTDVGGWLAGWEFSALALPPLARPAPFPPLAPHPATALPDAANVRTRAAMRFIGLSPI